MLAGRPVLPEQRRQLASRARPRPPCAHAPLTSSRSNWWAALALLLRRCYQRLGMWTGRQRDRRTSLPWARGQPSRRRSKSFPPSSDSGGAAGSPSSVRRARRLASRSPRWSARPARRGAIRAAAGRRGGEGPRAGSASPAGRSRVAVVVRAAEVARVQDRRAVRPLAGGGAVRAVARQRRRLVVLRTAWNRRRCRAVIVEGRAATVGIERVVRGHGRDGDVARVHVEARAQRA